METRQNSDRAAAYVAVVTYLGGQSFDIWWHAKNVSLVPETPVRLLSIHLGIYVGAALTVVAGGMLLRRSAGLLAGSLLVAGGLVQLAGFFLDMWEHGHGRTVDLYHNLLWYGFIIAAAGVVRMEASTESPSLGAIPAPDSVS
ncbi:MAG TPA: hypothetical protein VLL08_00770 [Kineosporiaceae bacterium]|nr:hypothetical protein [Kineosporiaceae bacterium]